MRYAYRMKSANQLSLFSSVQKAYQDGAADNAEVYDYLAKSGVIQAEDFQNKEKIGKTGAKHCSAKRKVRWMQQSLRQLGILEKSGSRGRWQLTPKAKDDLVQAEPKRVLLGFSTHLGMALWSSCEDVFSKIDEPIALALTSPPYPLAVPRAYGNPTEPQYVDWICHMLEPIVKNLVQGGSIVLNISNDIFMPKSPARSLYRERLVLALHDRLGLFKMDEIIWHNPCKAPGPVAWASKQRFQLNVAWEPVYWFTNDPSAVRSNNQRVLEPHTAQQTALIARGGNRIARINGDGSNRIKVGAFSNPTDGRIPRNVQSIPHNCTDQAANKRFMNSLGLQSHGASMPLALVQKLIAFLSLPDDLVVDPFGGSFTTAKGAELLGRRWLSTEIMGSYVAGGASRFAEFAGFAANFSIQRFGF